MNPGVIRVDDVASPDNVVALSLPRRIDLFVFPHGVSSVPSAVIARRAEVEKAGGDGAASGAAGSHEEAIDTKAAKMQPTETAARTPKTTKLRTSIMSFPL